MGILIPQPAKPFAVSSDRLGVPADEMQTLLGDETQTTLSTFGVPTDGNSTQARGFGVSNADHDLLYIRAFNASGTLVHAWTVPVTNFWATTRVAEGEDLASTSGTVYTASSSAGTILVARANGGRALVQRGTWDGSGAAFMRLVGVLHDGGILARRLAPYGDHISREIVLHRRSSVTPTAPVAGEVTYDGTSFTIDENSEWSPLEQVVTGDDAEYFASTTFRYSPSIATDWHPDTWTVYAADTTISVQYAMSSGGPWGTTIPTADSWFYRVRGSDLTWHGPFRSGETSPRADWITHFDEGFHTAAANFVWNFDSVDFRAARWHVFRWTQDSDPDTNLVTGQVRAVAIPGPFVSSVHPTNTGEQPEQILAQFGDFGSSWSIGGFTNQLSTWMSGANANEQRIRIDLKGTAQGAKNASQINVRRGYTSGNGRMQWMTL